MDSSEPLTSVFYFILAEPQFHCKSVKKCESPFPEVLFYCSVKMCENVGVKSGKLVGLQLLPRMSSDDEARVEPHHSPAAAAVARHRAGVVKGQGDGQWAWKQQQIKEGAFNATRVKGVWQMTWPWVSLMDAKGPPYHELLEGAESRAGNQRVHQGVDQVGTHRLGSSTWLNRG